MNDSETKELHENLKKWFDNSIEKLEMISDADSGVDLLIKNNEGKEVAVKGDIKKGIEIGCKIAIDILGDFPLEIEEN